VQDLDARALEQLQLPQGTRGVVVTEVDPSSAAASAGLDRGDVIVEVNHKPVHNVSEYKQAVAAAGKGSLLLLVEGQGGVTQYMVIESQ